MDKIAVIIPCYNEGQTIRQVVEDFKRALPDGSVIYVYDNNSSDNTANAAEAAGAVVRREYQQGKGNVIRRAFMEIDAQCYLLVDGDNTYPAESAPEMIAPILSQKADMVIGDRLSSTYFQENKRPFHNIGNSIVQKSIRILFGENIKDILTGYRALSYRFAKTFPVLSKGFEIETEMCIHSVDKNMPVENVIIQYRNRPDGSTSKLHTYSDGRKILLTIFRLFRTYRPLQFFGVLAAVLAAVSIAFFIPIMVAYLKTGLVPRFPTLIICGFVMIAAIQSMFSGLILQTINQKNRQDFEMELHRVTDQFKKQTQKETLL